MYAPRLVPRAYTPVVQRCQLEAAQRRRAESTGLRGAQAGVPTAEPTAQVLQPELVVHVERSRLFREEPVPVSDAATARFVQRLRYGLAWVWHWKKYAQTALGFTQFNVKLPSIFHGKNIPYIRVCPKNKQRTFRNLKCTVERLSIQNSKIKL